MIDPEEKLLAAIREEESDFAEALQEANDILYPDPAKALATAISERKTAVREWKDSLERCKALTADLDAIRGMVGRYGHGVTAVEAVRALVAAHGEARVAAREASTVLKAAESGGAVEDAELVAWLLTHRDELIRLARIADLPEARTRKDLP